MTAADRPVLAEKDDIVVEYVETQFDREFIGDDGVTYIDGLPYRAEHQGLRAAATTQEGARAMIRRMLDRRANPPANDGSGAAS